MLEVPVIALTAKAILMLLQAQCAPMSDLSGTCKESFAELHKEGRRARRERLDKLPPCDQYQGQCSFLGQYVDGGFTSPRAGWQDIYHKDKNHEKLLEIGRQAAEEMGGDPSRIQELFD